MAAVYMMTKLCCCNWLLSLKPVKNRKQMELFFTLIFKPIYISPFITSDALLWQFTKLRDINFFPLIAEQIEEVSMWLEDAIIFFCSAVTEILDWSHSFLMQIGPQGQNDWPFWSSLDIQIAQVFSKKKKKKKGSPCATMMSKALLAYPMYSTQST